MYSLFFCIMRKTIKTKPCFAYFTNYCVFDDWGWYGEVMMIGTYTNILWLSICWILGMLWVKSLRLSSVETRSCNTFYWWSHKHNNNSNISNNYSELKFIGVFLFSLRFPAVFGTHSFNNYTTRINKCFLKSYRIYNLGLIRTVFHIITGLFIFIP